MQHCPSPSLPSAGADALGQLRTRWSHPTASPCTRAGCVPGSSWSTPHGLIPQMPALHHPPLQKGPPSAANKPLQVTLLGKPDSFINIHNVNCCNWKAGFPLLGVWVCAAVWKHAEECEGGIAPAVVMVTTGLCCVWVPAPKEQGENQTYLPVPASLQAKNTAEWVFKC